MRLVVTCLVLASECAIMLFPGDAAECFWGWRMVGRAITTAVRPAGLGERPSLLARADEVNECGA
jgi:hypothetical protein